MHPFLQKLQEQPLLVDGAMGTLLYAKGISNEQNLESFVLQRPEWVTEVHQAYASAGADVIKTHTFGANRLRLSKYGLEESVHAINFTATKLVRDVREVAGRGIFIAGDIGSLGERIEPHGVLSEEEASSIYREQISALWEAGVDLLLFETFNSIIELSLAVRVARELCDLPIAASMTFAEDGISPISFEMAAMTAERLTQQGADVIGINCLVDSNLMLETLQAIHSTVDDVPLIAMPNAGYPSRVDGRLSYSSSPGQMAGHVVPFVERGVKLIGGCCGTTPSHIWAMRGALDAHLVEEGAGAITVRDNFLAQSDSSLTIGMTSHQGDDEEQPPTQILEKIRAGKFVISVEVDPPRGFTPQKQIEGARHAMEMGADAINVADSPMARVRMSAVALCTLIQHQVGIETILHYTTRDRSLMALQSELIGCRALGIRNILALTGDAPSLGDSQGSSAVFDTDSIGLCRMINQFNQGLDQNGKELGQKGGYTIAVACDPTRPDLVEEVDRFHRKVTGGAHFTMTQPIYDPQLWLNFLKLYEERHGEFPVPVMIGVLPVQSHRHATFLHQNVPGITLSDEALERMRLAGADGRQEGVTMAQELLLNLKELPYVQGVYLMPSFGRYELACQVLEVLSTKERAVA